MKLRFHRRLIYLPPPHWWLRWGQYLLFGFGLLLLGYSGLVMMKAVFFQARQARQFDQALSRRPSPSGRSSPSPLPAQPLAEGAVVGRIEITRLGLEAMILEGIDDGTLAKAVGHFPDTALPGQSGNVALAGHRDTFFSPLRHVRQDDEIRLTTLAGTYRYRVDSIQVVPPDYIRVLDHTPGHRLTLVTCYPFNFIGLAPQRFIVGGHRIAG